MPLPREQAWFHAKTYGYGWGLPARWQGWICLLGHFGGVAGSAALWMPRHPDRFAAATLVLSAILIGICWWKGEPLKWRWGGQ